MTSEAAQKAYPIQNWQDGGWRKGVYQDRQKAFDRGAVEALRQAAMNAEVYGDFSAQEWLRQMRDEWEAGQ